VRILSNRSATSPRQLHPNIRYPFGKIDFAVGELIDHHLGIVADDSSQVYHQHDAPPTPTHCWVSSVSTYKTDLAG
jgi:hypothetical protein